MAYIRTPAPDPATAATFDAMRDAFGFVPNFYQMQTARPDLIAAHLDLTAAILIANGALTRREKEYVFLVCSGDNLSTYCVTAHCEMVRMLQIQGPEPEQIALNFEAADLPDSIQALLRFALRLNRGIALSGDYLSARQAGYADQHLEEAARVVGLAQFANAVAFGIGTVADFTNPIVSFKPSEL